MVFSFSRLNTYEKCPYRFFLKYVRLLEEDVTKPLALGKAIHGTIEAFINGSDKEDALLSGYAASEMHPEVTRDELESLLRAAPIFSGMGKTEIHFELPLSDDEEAPRIQGYIDLVEQIRITDWKSNFRLYAISDSWQLPLYAWAHMKLTGFTHVWGRLFFLRYPKYMSSPKYSRMIEFSEADAARRRAYELASRIEGLLNRWEATGHDELSFFPALPSKECKNCSFAIECYKKRRERDGKK